MGLFGPTCRHEWEKIDKEVFESAFEQIERTHTVSRIAQGGPWMFRKKVVWLLRCKHCTEHKTIVEEFDPF